MIIYDLIEMLFASMKHVAYYSLMNNRNNNEILEIIKREKKPAAQCVLDFATSFMVHLK